MCILTIRRRVFAFGMLTMIGSFAWSILSFMQVIKIATDAPACVPGSSCSLSVQIPLLIQHVSNLPLALTGLMVDTCLLVASIKGTPRLLFCWLVAAAGRIPAIFIVAISMWNDDGFAIYSEGFAYFVWACLFVEVTFQIIIIYKTTSMEVKEVSSMLDDPSGRESETWVFSDATSEDPGYSEATVVSEGGGGDADTPEFTALTDLATPAAQISEPSSEV